ncbi:DUF4097 domain-containing protein [Nonomuraea sp. NPDC059007]|uniref:DUF4097 family beta strand repeat-containing protein n=1 Tax=Nonomuraea sp. NPDC059007 TaxID=3346692 RepID=UPI00369812F6
MPVFETPEPILAVIALAAGDVRITATGRSDTSVEVRPSDAANDEDVSAAGSCEIEFLAGRLTIRTPRQDALAGRSGSVEVTVELPEASGLEADVAAGGVRCAGRLGETRVTASHGEIDLDRTGRLEAGSGSGAIRVGAVDGQALIKTLSGNVHLGEVSGDLRAGTAHGDIVVERALSGVQAKTAHGDIRIGEVVRGLISVSTGLGEVEVGVRAGTVARLNIGSTYGRVRNLLQPGAAPGPAEDHVEVSASTTHGDVLIHHS